MSRDIRDFQLGFELALRGVLFRDLLLLGGHGVWCLSQRGKRVSIMSF